MCVISGCNDAPPGGGNSKAAQLASTTKQEANAIANADNQVNVLTPAWYIQRS
jgi:hypothetical protein